MQNIKHNCAWILTEKIHRPMAHTIILIVVIILNCFVTTKPFKITTTIIIGNFAIPVRLMGLNPNVANLMQSEFEHAKGSA